VKSGDICYYFKYSLILRTIRPEFARITANAPDAIV